MRRAQPPILDLAERARLERMARGAKGARAGIVLAAADGHPDIAIARRLGIDRLTVGRWRRRFLRAGISGLEDAVRVAHRGRVAPGVWRDIVREALRPDLASGRRRSTRALARQFQVSHMSVQRVLRAYRLRLRRPSTFPPRADPVRRPAAWDVAGLFLDPPLAAIALTIPPLLLTGSRPEGPDGSPTPASALRPWVSLPPLLPGEPGNAEGSGRPALTRLTRFLSGLGQRIPEPGRLRILLVAPHQTSPALDRWRLEHPGIAMEESVSLDRWREAVGRELAAVGRVVPTSARRGGRAEPARSLRSALHRVGPRGAPFEWTAEPAEIEKGEALYRLRYRLAVTAGERLKSRSGDRSAMTADKGREESARRLARSVLGPYLRVRRGERVTIDCWTSTLPEANAMVLEALRRNARPLLLYQDEPTYWAAATEVPADHLATLGGHRKAAIAGSDVFISFFGPSDRERFHALPEATMLRLCAFEDAVYEAARRAGARGVQLALGRVSPASARMYGVDEGAWRQELLEAALVSPQKLHRAGTALSDRLHRGRRLEIRHPNGTAITLRLRGYRPQVSDGQVRPARTRSSWQLVTLPAGVVTVAVDEAGAEGVFRSNLASSVGLSDSVGEMEGGRWEFRAGRLTGHAYTRGGEFFDQSFSKAGPGRDRVASVAIGLNPALHHAPLLEDQGLGTVTLSIGRNDHLGGRTKAGWWAWSFLEGADVTLDGAPILRHGRAVGRRSPRE